MNKLTFTMNLIATDNHFDNKTKLVVISSSFGGPASMHTVKSLK